MKHWTIKKQIFLLIAITLSTFVIAEGVNYVASKSVVEKYNLISDVYVPAVKEMQLIDMYHEQVMSTTYKSLYYSKIPDGATHKAEIREEIDKVKKDLADSFEALNKLSISPEAHQVVKELEAGFDEYLKTEEAIYANTFGPEPKPVAELLVQLEKNFHKLEATLEEKVEQVIIKESENKRLEAQNLSGVFEQIQIMIFSVGVIFSLLAGWILQKNIMKNLTSIILDMKKTTEGLVNSAGLSSSSAHQLSESSTQQASSLQQTMASVEEISAMVSQNSESTEKALKQVNENKNVTLEGSRSVADMQVAVQDIKKINDQISNEMANINKEFSSVVQIISDIGEKTKVINDIVFQTKLLSFNASVEAARAGEHGKGFAVVAEEVGNLAQMSGNSANEITQMLSQSIKKVNEIISTASNKIDHIVEAGHDKVASGQATADKCNQIFGKILQSSEMVSTMISEIAHASKEQSQGVMEINKAIAELDKVTQQNNSVAQVSSDQAMQLKEQAEVLSEVTHRLSEIVDPSLDGKPSHSEPPQQEQVPKKKVLSLSDFKKTKPKKSEKVSASGNAAPKFEDF